VTPGNGIQIIEHVPMHGEALFRAIVEHDQEGIVAKQLDAPYRWSAVELVEDQEQRVFAPRCPRVARLIPRERGASAPMHDHSVWQSMAFNAAFSIDSAAA